MVLKRSTKAAIISGGIGLPVAVIISALIYWDLNRPTFQRLALPRCAQDVQEYISSSWQGNYILVIKARIPEKEFMPYVKRIGVITKYDPKVHDSDVYMALRMHLSEPKWWDAPDDFNKCYFNINSNKGFISWARYVDGVVYVLFCQS